MKKIFLLGLGVFFLIASTVVGQNTQPKIIHKAVITSSVRWSGNILIKGDVVVAPGGRLQIEPGTRIAFAPKQDEAHSGQDKTRAELIVKGAIFAKGTINNKIVFTSAASNPRMKDWSGIVIVNLKNPAVFEFAVVEYAFNGFDIKKSNPIIRNCQIQFNYNAGVKIAVRSKARLIGNIITDNGYAGVICETGAQPVLTDNLITKNQIGLIVFGTAAPNLGNLQKGNDYNPGRNALFDNLEYDVYNHGVRDIKAEGNSWGTNTLENITQHVYDKSDSPRFGVVDFNPIVGNVDLMQKLLLSQKPVKTKPDTTQNVAQTQTSAPPAVAPKNVAPQVSTRQSPAQAKPKLDKPLPNLKAGQQDTTGKQVLAAATPTSKPTTDTLSEKSEVASKQTSTPPPSSMQSRKPQPDEQSKPAEPQIDFNQVFLDVFLDEKVQVIKWVKPIVDDPSKGMYEHGRIVVRVVVDKNGKVEKANVLKGLNYYYDSLALDAARKFIFKPGTVKNHPVRFSTSILFKF